MDGIRKYVWRRLIDVPHDLDRIAFKKVYPFVKIGGDPADFTIPDRNPRAAILEGAGIVHGVPNMYALMEMGTLPNVLEICHLGNRIIHSRFAIHVRHLEFRRCS